MTDSNEGVAGRLTIPERARAVQEQLTALRQYVRANAVGANIEAWQAEVKALPVDRWYTRRCMICGDMLTHHTGQQERECERTANEEGRDY